MRILRYAGEDRAPDEWKPISTKDLNQWRKDRRRRVAEGTSSYGVQTGYRKLPRVDAEDGDTATLNTRKLTDQKPLDPLETQASVMADAVAWLNDPTATHEQRVARVTILRAFAGPRYAHLTDGEIAEQIGSVARALARESAERVYRKRGWDTPTDITPGGVRTVDTGPRYDADVWKVPTGEAPEVDRRYPWQRSTDS